jgi:hypothetical protein
VVIKDKEDSPEEDLINKLYLLKKENMSKCKEIMKKLMNLLI